MKKIVSIIVSIVILGFLILFLVLPKKTFSANENRYLSNFPTFNLNNILNGSYMTKIEKYVEDHFPLREEFLNIKTNVFKLVGMKKQNDVYFGKDGYLLQEFLQEENSDRIIRIVNKFAKANSNVNINFLLAPTSIYIYNDKMPYKIDISEKDTIDKYKNELEVNFIDVIDSLINNKDKGLYYKTDHHWTTYGAYIAYLKFCEVYNIVPNEYQFITVNENFYGTLYSKVIDKTLKPDTIEKIIDDYNYDVYYDEEEVSNTMYSDKYLNEKDKYSYFLDGNHALTTVVNNDINSNKELLIIKDSYANSFIPLITRHYKKIHVIDPRIYNKSINDYIAKNSISDVLFLYNVLTIDKDLGILSINS